MALLKVGFLKSTFFVFCLVAIAGFCLGLVMRPLLFDERATSVDSVIAVKESANTNLSRNTPKTLAKLPKSKLASRVAAIQSGFDAAVNTGDTSEEVMLSMLNSASDSQVHEALDLFFDSEELYSNIDDVKGFTRRIIEEAGNKNSSTHELSTAQILFSSVADYPVSSKQTFDGKKGALIFAHIDVQGGLGLGDKKFFTRWTHLDSGEVLLFKQKAISPGSPRNWISYQPNGEWQQGSYEITFYQFNSELNKLASAVFYVE